MTATDLKNIKMDSPLLLSTTLPAPNIHSSLDVFRTEVLPGRRQSYSETYVKFYDIFLPALSGTIILLNLLVVLSSGLILHKKQQPRGTYIFLGNIALADMLTGSATLLRQYYPKDKQTDLVCSIHLGMVVSSILASIYSIGLIAIDRYLYIMHGLKYKLYVTSKRARLMVLGTWVIGGVVGFLPAMGVRNHTNGFCALIFLEPAALLLATSTVGIAPLLMIFVLYCIILRQAFIKIREQRVATLPSSSTFGLRYFRGERERKKDEISNGYQYHSTDISAVDETIHEEPRRWSFLCCCRRRTTIKSTPVYNPSRWKAVKIVVLTTGCFFITWCPYFMASVLYITCAESDSAPRYCKKLRLAIASPLVMLGMSNCIINPIIYAWWHNGFRTSVKRIFFNLWYHSILPLFQSDRRQNPRSLDSKIDIKLKIEDETTTE